VGVLVVALDGATFDVLHPWLAAGRLPNLARLIAEGSSGELASTLPPLTAPAWASFMTGKNPGKHGVFDFFRPRLQRDSQPADLDRFELVDSTQVRGRLFWEDICAAGLRAGVLNVPLTHPPRPVAGYVVPGLLSPDEGRTTHPPGLLLPYEAELGRYRLTPDGLFRPEAAAAFVADLEALTDTQVRWARRLFAENPADFQMVHFLATDIAQHKLWRYHDPTHPWHVDGQQDLHENAEDADGPGEPVGLGGALARLFQRLDRALGELLDQAPPATTVLVLSDHGFGPQHLTVNLNRHLLAAGSLRLRRRPATWARRWPPTRHWLRPLGFADVDWSRTLAYSLGHLGQVYLNVAGRQPRGIVDPDDYDTVRQRVAEQLRRLRHPETGEPLVAEVVPAEDAAHGPHLALGPDLHVVMTEGATAYPMFAAGHRLVTEQRDGNSGDHRANGLLVVAGPAVRRGATLLGARIVDVAPTILYLLGVPIPDDMDGRVLREAIRESHLADHPVVTREARAEVEPAGERPRRSDQDAVAERLRALGYLGSRDGE
jgi:predicted AlkP superfamily phosphohydrolase/phosphomutase